MQINELDVAGAQVDLAYNDSLNPLFWRGFELEQGVYEQLTHIASAFVKFLEIPEDYFVEFIITGSNASYNWSDFSDLDLHVLVDFAALTEVAGAFIVDYLNTKRQLWNKTHNITLKGVRVECYVQDIADEHYSNGQYSLKSQTWIKKPEHKPFNYVDSEIVTKAEDLIAQIDTYVEGDCSDEKLIDDLIAKIRAMRKCGLERDGEGSVENLVYKVLRAMGYTSKLYACRDSAQDKGLSL